MKHINIPTSILFIYNILVIRLYILFVGFQYCFKQVQFLVFYTTDYFTNKDINMLLKNCSNKERKECNKIMF